MRQCSRCGLFGDAASFYPGAPEHAWCKSCISLRRSVRVKSARARADQQNREQAAVRSIVKQFQCDGRSYLYLVESQHRFKIGYSTDIEKRLRAFDTAHSLSCRLLVAAPGGSQQEQQLHRKFEPYRVTREWFLGLPHILNHFKRLPEALVFLPGHMTSEPPAAERIGALTL